MKTYKLLIGGKLVDGDMTMDVLNPATEEVISACPRASEKQLNEAVAAAKAAFPAWSKTPIEERKKLLIKLADKIAERADELARSLTAEQGKPLPEAQWEIGGAEGFLRYFASLDLPVEVLEDTPQKRVEAHRKPLGVVGAIIPWNFPVLLAMFKLPPALLAGNTIVMKPSPTTPLSTLLLGEMIAEVIPAGVVNIITDQNELGAALTKHPDIAKVSFTGSTATGKKVMASVAETLKRLTLELGGNDAAIVLDDADPKKTAPQIFGGAFMNAGQVCLAIKRLYVHESIYDEMCEELTKVASTAIVGDGLEQGTTMGPLQNKMQFEKVKGFLADAKKNGKIIAGGDVPNRPGYFILPTIVRDIAEGAMLVDEEQFGPVLPVIKYGDVNDAVSRANASPYGLGGSVWTSNIERGKKIAEQIEAGTVWVNAHIDLAPNIPFGGAKQSGVGSELGQSGLEEYTQRQVISITL